MRIVSDTSPINYLVLIGAAEVLPVLYGTVHVPPACEAELLSDGTPADVRRWFATRPSWLHVTAPSNAAYPSLSRLDAGEREAITLALGMAADFILIDERDGRRAARACGLAVAGTLRVLADAADVGLIDPVDVVARLRSTTFRVDPALLDILLARKKPS